MKKYSEIISYLKEKSSIPHSRYFEFNEKDNNFFNEFYLFHQANLDRQYLHYKFEINPAYLYFIDSPEINALATPPRDGIFLVGISRGLIELFDSKLHRYFDISKYNEIEGIKLIQSCIKNSIGELMYQSLMLFTFYHEVGHLIEFSQNSYNQEKDEKLTNNCDEFNQDDHIKEADADIFAAINIGAHLYQYFEKYFKCKWNENIIKTYISIISSSVFTYFLSLNEYHDKLYFESKSHPHPLVRLYYSLEVIVDYFTKILKKKNTTFRINQIEIIKESFIISEVMIKEFFDEMKYLDFKNIVIERNLEIINYKNKLKSSVYNKITSAVNERNKKIKSLKNKL